MQRPSARRFVITLLAVATLAVLVTWLGRSTLQRAANRARSTLQPAELGPAAELEILSTAAEDERAGDFAAAIESLHRLPPRFDSYDLYTAWLKKAELQQRIGRLSDARETLSTIIAGVDGEVTSRRRLAELLAGCGHAFEALTPLQELLSIGETAEEDLFRLAVNGHDLFGWKTLERFHVLDPSDELTIAGLITLAQSERDAAGVVALMQNAEPENEFLSRTRIWLRLYAGLGEPSRESNSPGDADSSLVAATNAMLDRSAVHPESCLIAAEVSRSVGDPKTALGCLVQVIEQDPWNQRALRLAVDLLRGDDPAFARRILDLAKTTETVERLAREIRQGQRDSERFRKLCESLVSLGRKNEAKAWARIAFKKDPKSNWALATVREAESPVAFVHPMLKRFARNGDDTRLRILLKESGERLPKKQSDLGVHFEDVAAEVGIRFRYDNGRRAGQEGLFMHQWTGGGVGVLDLDGDTWPDLCFSQGGTLANQGKATPGEDALYLNRRGNWFDDVSGVAISARQGFGQGVAVGDVNNDGFDDLYIARVGRNLLLINQGDGTLLLHDAASQSSAWTTSVAIADLNGDSHPDIYDVNYLGGDNVFASTCDHGGVQRICGPTDFPAEEDAILLSSGDGTFVNPTLAGTRTSSGVLSEARAGMGLIVGNFLNEDGPQIYVANDEGGNQLLTPGTSHDGAMFAGVAVGADGTPLGSMGVALADANGDGSADLFVTNYYSEPNNLYSQVQAGVFVDATSESGLAAAGFSMLGFGCQFADFDSDGDQDLMVSNGHLDDFTHLGRPFRMPPHLFFNEGKGRFRTVLPQGNYFSKQWLGRAVALLDWNWDGRTDFAVTHVDDHVSLVENRCDPSMQLVSVTVRAKTTSRNAVGTVLRTTIAGELQSQWVTAGDGYQCSNQKVCRFAVPSESKSFMVEVTWPNGVTEEVTMSSAQRGVQLVIEGRKKAYAIPH